MTFVSNILRNPEIVRSVGESTIYLGIVVFCTLIFIAIVVSVTCAGVSLFKFSRNPLIIKKKMIENILKIQKTFDKHQLNILFYLMAALCYVYDNSLFYISLLILYCTLYICKRIDKKCGK
jgi:mannose/fructose/N-acetylgalactosamine-specific phosphotransferase system component IID